VKNLKLIIVESPTKAKTISRFLKNGYQVMATMGHIRDLPKNRFGVKVIEDGEIKFEPQYRIIPDKRKIVAELKEKIKKADQVILATDPDREGEAIAYHVTVVGSNSKFSRIVFHEITATAIEGALQEARLIDMNLVNAQQARRVLDRIVGYKLSPLLWSKVRRGLSAGRVQSVAVRLIVEREREIEKFKTEKYFRILGAFKARKGGEFIAELVRVAGKPVEIKQIYPLFVGKHRVAKTIFDRRAQAEAALLSLSFQPRVKDIKERKARRHPPPPFTTSKLQQDAARRFGWSSKLTMRVAQSLYERGLITYHRTDSTNLSKQFLSQARDFIKLEFGKRYLPEKPVVYKTTSKLAQEAHEAIRPTKPERIGIKRVDNRQKRLYQLIWQRAIACQMSPAILALSKVEIEDGEYLFFSQGSRVLFEGFSKVYPVSFSEISLPKMKKGEVLEMISAGVTEHQTQPPPRYNEASLIATLESEGIGRPSTYAPIVSIIQQRSYVEKEEGRFIPTNLGTAVTDFLVKHFPDILSLPFTAKMELSLDEIAQGRGKWMKVVGKFWRPFIKKLGEVKESSQRVKIKVEKIGEKCPKCGEGELVVRVGRFGKFIACSRFPECRYTKPLVKEAGFNCPECGSPAVIRKTKKGRKFYGCSDWPSCKWAAWRKPKKN
jgi:DNA topoisomerase-1